MNRAIDEVENGQVPAVVLVCRNSTDTGGRGLARGSWITLLLVVLAPPAPLPPFPALSLPFVMRSWHSPAPIYSPTHATLCCSNPPCPHLPGYFQRLRPYPRVLLRRTSARFKDYSKTPIGFGIAVFCIARENVR